MIRFILFLILLSSCSVKEQKKALPFIGDYDLIYKIVDGDTVVDTVYTKIPDFEYMTQDSTILSRKSLNGKILIADFFFTSCTTICPLMTKNMKYVDSALRNYSKHLALLSFTINPDYDTPNVLRRYMKKYAISSKNWLFLRGNEKQTHQLGIENFKVFATRDDNVSDGFAHSGAFTLVDKEGFVRGVYIGTDSEEIKKLVNDTKLLLKEEYNVN